MLTAALGVFALNRRRRKQRSASQTYIDDQHYRATTEFGADETKHNLKRGDGQHEAYADIPKAELAGKNIPTSTELDAQPKWNSPAPTYQSVERFPRPHKQVVYEMAAS